jgi:transposase
MSQKKQTTGTYIRDIKRKTKRKFSSEEKIRTVLMGIRGEVPVAELCRQLGIVESLYYKWSKDFLEAGKQRLNGDIKRQANTSEVARLRKERDELKHIIAEQVLDIRVLKKSLNGES